MRLLARREYGRAELLARLRARRGEPGAAEAVVDELAAQGLVSDARFVEALVRNRLERGHGPVRVARELREKGIDDAVIQDALAGLGEEWLARLRTARRKRFGEAPPADFRELAKQIRFLQSRGFTLEQIRTVIDTTAVD